MSAQPLTTSATLSRANYPRQPTTRDLSQRKPEPDRGTGNHPVSRTRSPCSAADHRRKWRDSISDMPCAEHVVTSRTDVGRAPCFAQQRRWFSSSEQCTRNPLAVTARLICTGDGGYAPSVSSGTARSWAEHRHHRPLTGPVLPGEVQHPRERHGPQLTDGEDKRVLPSAEH